MIEVSDAAVREKEIIIKLIGSNGNSIDSGKFNYSASGKLNIES